MIDAAQIAWMAAAAATAAVLSLWLSNRLARNAVPGLRILDEPNNRSLHAIPVPRTGGVALIAGGAGGIAVLSIANGFPALSGLQPGAAAGFPTLGWVTAAALVVAVVSFLDDRGHVAQRWRLAAHAAAALLLIVGGVHWAEAGLPGLPGTLPIWAVPPLSMIYVVWMINLYNFMDGMDGFAGGMAVIGFGALAVLGWQGGEPLYIAAALVTAAAAGGFLVRNLPPAQIFLGDTGSATLGLLAAAMTLWGARLGLFPLWVGWLVFSPFIVDATWTLVRRILAGEPFWLAHRSHHYQRLVLAGWGHRKTLLWSYVIMTAAAATAVAAVRLPVREQWMIIGAWGVVYVLIHVRVGLAQRLASEQHP